ncbi:hypothetical protein CFAM422_008184 [Trichoderma lentiforme]|uniref:Uncharacterized protein n=1 Tax=Trichoderma lentiforme TaxID=1567552 RepID=A0A9P4XD49_9HYPO|nr:hypothetical protein CFAM422_008184 [Trichoderma lentiforme]
MSSNARYSHGLHRRLVHIYRELTRLCCINGLSGFNGLNGLNGLNGFNRFEDFNGSAGFDATLLMSSIGWKKDVSAEHAFNRRTQTLK